MRRRADLLSVNVTVAGVSVEQTVRNVARHAGILGGWAREIEGRKWDAPANE
jgi:hypothetical protein